MHLHIPSSHSLAFRNPSPGGDVRDTAFFHIKYLGLLAGIEHLDLINIGGNALTYLQDKEHCEMFIDVVG